jgi:diguanylate cyclase (GGDEF)-like protein
MTNCPLAASMEDGKAREAEVFVHHADGHRLPIVVRASPIRDSEGNIIGAVESFSNNTSVFEARSKLRELRQAVSVDSLTEVHNRKYLEGRLHAAIAEYQTSETVSGLLFIDVDHFKSLNDTYGHNVGDDVLRMVARTIRYAVRATDIVGRWGGEEFIVILHDLQDAEAICIPAEKIRVLVECSQLNHNGNLLSVTVSIGGTVLHPGDTPESIVQRADQFMYQSKKSGRNRVSVG